MPPPSQNKSPVVTTTITTHLGSIPSATRTTSLVSFLLIPSLPPKPSMPIKAGSRPAPKGVEFSDHLIVLGAASQSSHPHRHTSLPLEDGNVTPFHTSPSLPYRPPGKRRARFFDHAPDLISDHKPTPPLRPFDEPVETSCTDSEEDHTPFSNQASHQPCRPPPDQTLETCTRINTKLNSLPSGGAFSLMNSSDDVHLSSSDDDEHLSSSRKLIRVQGSAKLSSASGLDEESFDIDDDEFAIEGAEEVDEEEAINVRSFGRSFARVCLEDDLEDGDQQPTNGEKEKSQVAFDLPDDQILADPQPRPVDEQPVTNDSPSLTRASSDRKKMKKTAQQVFAESRSAPPRRKSRLRLTFVRRASIADRKEATREPTTEAGTTANVLDDSVSGVTRLSCFPTRKSPTKHRIKFCESKNTSAKDTATENRPGTSDGAYQMVAVPEFDVHKDKPSMTRKNRKMVKNISMQRDDWIDFATNSPHRQRSQWLTRFISASGGGSEVSSKGDSRGMESESNRERRNNGWRILRFWSRK